MPEPARRQRQRPAGTSRSQPRPTADLAIAAHRDHHQTTLKRGARCLGGSLRQIGRKDPAQLALAAGLRQRGFDRGALGLGAVEPDAALMKISRATDSTVGGAGISAGAFMSRD